MKQLLLALLAHGQFTQGRRRPSPAGAPGPPPGPARTPANAPASAAPSTAPPCRPPCAVNSTSTAEPLRHQFVGLPFGAGSPHRLQRLGAVPDRLQQLPPLGPAELVLRQRAQVEVAPGRHEGARGQRGHLAVAHVGPAAHPEGLLHRLDGRDIQGIVGRVAGHDGGGQRHAQRVEDGGRDLELGPVGVVLAVAELQEPLLGQDVGVGVGGGGVDADEVGGELVDADGLLVQVALQGGEGGRRGRAG